jgi:hypothetical protein
VLRKRKWLKLAKKLNSGNTVLPRVLNGLAKAKKQG